MSVTATEQSRGSSWSDMQRCAGNRHEDAEEDLDLEIDLDDEWADLQTEELGDAGKGD